MRTERFDTPGHVALVVRVDSGEVDLTTSETKVTTVELEGDDELVADARIDSRPRAGGHEVVIEVDRKRRGFRLWGGDGCRVSISAPLGADLEFQGGATDLRTVGQLGSAEVESGSGDVTLDAVDEDASVKAGSGDVEIERVGARLDVQTGSGDVEVGTVAGAAKIRCGSGDVTIREAGGDVSVQTASGDQEIGSVAAGSVTLQAASGDIDVGVRRGSRLWVDARSMSGETSSELDVGDAPVDDEGPLVELRATAMSGEISIRRA